jgi:hypothetical protein
MAVFVDQWQTLIGAAMGGVIALFIATVVAGNQRWRDLRMAAARVAPQVRRFPDNEPLILLQHGASGLPVGEACQNARQPC